MFGFPRLNYWQRQVAKVIVATVMLAALVLAKATISGAQAAVTSLVELLG